MFAARFAAGSVHGAFIGVASVAAASIAGAGREGRALSIVFGGVALSTVIGVPLGTLVGQAFGWRATFVGVVIIGVITLGLTLAIVPPIRSRPAGDLANAAGSAFAPPVLATLGVGLLIIGGQFTMLTYLEPLLARVTDVSGGTISAFLLAYGVATAVGTFVGGRAADRSATATLIAANAALIAVLVALYAVAPDPALVVLVLIAWGLVGFGLVSTALQLRVISLAGSGGDLAASVRPRPTPASPSEPSSAGRSSFMAAYGTPLSRQRRSAYSLCPLPSQPEPCGRPASCNRSWTHPSTDWIPAASSAPGSGVAMVPAAAQLVLTEPDGTEHVSPVVDGGW